MAPGATVADLDVDPASNTIGDKLLGMMEATYAEGNTRDPALLKPFIAQGRKMILYHGASDPSIPASQSIAFYRELAEQQQGVERTQQNVRLFLVPGMHHCSGGPGPDRFDTLSALETWVERGKAPDVIEASTRPDSPVQHRLPLCPYPRQALSRNGRDRRSLELALRGGRLKVMFLSPLSERLGEEVNTKTVSCIAPSPIVAGFRIRVEGAMTVRVLCAILVLALIIPTGCSPTPAPDDGQTPEG